MTVATSGLPSRMPDFCRPRRGARHTLDTALRALRRIGLDDARVVVESAGPGAEAGSVVRQSPAPGTVLDERTPVVLGVAGVGALEALPYALRDVDDSAFGVDPLMELFDNPVYKLRHHLRGGGEFFALRAGDPVTARRWIEQVFGIDPTRWVESRWSAIARLLPVLHRVAGREASVALALRVVCDLPVAEVTLRRATLPLDASEQLTLGIGASRLGVDTLLGSGLVDLARLEVMLGPVPLGTYLAHDTPARRGERQALYELVLPARFVDTVDERWTVGDVHAPTVLGAATKAESPGPPLRDTEALSAGVPALGLTTRLAPPPITGA